MNISSMGANFTFPGGGVYHATKYAVEAISDALRFEVKGFGVDVVVVQPGLIRSRFGETAAAGVDGARARTRGSNASVAEATMAVYEKGPLARLGGDPEDVAKAVQRAITSRSPRIRMRVTPSARMLITQRRLMTARMWDRFLATQFSRPE